MISVLLHLLRLLPLIFIGNRAGRDVLPQALADRVCDRDKSYEHGVRPGQGRKGDGNVCCSKGRSRAHTAGADLASLIFLSTSWRSSVAVRSPVFSTPGA